MRHDLARYDVVSRPFKFRTQLNKDVKVALRDELLGLFRDDPALLGVPGSLALDRDGSLSLRVSGQDIDAAGVAHRDRGDEAPAGEFSRDKVFAGNARKLRAGFHCKMLRRPARR